eukprot:2997772-Pyramimonas_sp.AAC.1
MATVVQALDLPLSAPESALRKYAFLSQNSFRLDAGEAPEMLESGAQRAYTILAIIIFGITMLTTMSACVVGSVGFYEGVVLGICVYFVGNGLTVAALQKGLQYDLIVLL